MRHRRRRGASLLARPNLVFSHTNVTKGPFDVPLRSSTAGRWPRVATDGRAARRITGAWLSAAPHQAAHPEFPESTCQARRALAARGPQRRSEALAEFHGLESEVGASGVQLNAENRCGFGSKSNSLRMGGLPRRGFAAARLLPLALVLRRVGRVPGTMSASAPMCVALYVK